ncbi:MAG: hypothetical protein AAF208_00840 [Cyanobacteria bacterium P01_A01_bin.45]
MLNLPLGLRKSNLSQKLHGKNARTLHLVILLNHRYNAGNEEKSNDRRSGQNS